MPLQGPNYCIGGYGGEGAAGALSIAQGYRFLSTGDADVMLAGGSESCLTPCVMAGFNQMPQYAIGFADAPHRARCVGRLGSGGALGGPERGGAGCDACPTARQGR